MPQETNLNVAPYFDDFDPRSNYYKVLFKPAYPVQARELNNLQSILQNQIESVGNNLYKEGSVVIPGNLNYNDLFYGVQIQQEFLGVPVQIYLDQLLGKKITGQSSGITAEVVTYVTDSESQNGNFTLYVNYLESSTDNSTETFFDNEVLTVNEGISYQTTFISAGEGFANTIVEDASQTGSAFVVSEGVFFIRGNFVTVQSQLLILDQYGTQPSYRIGLLINEELISSDIDPQLTDNAQGFNNYTAPGADRLKISCTLVKKDSDDFNDENFVQLAEVQRGLLRTKIDDTKYNLLGDELAKRTFEESGNYYINEFVTSVKESLNNQEGNRGVYEPGQITVGGNVPSDDLLVYKVSPGKAYVKGYEVDIRSPSLIDVRKPRDTRLLENQAVNFAFGPTIEVNNVSGSPIIGFDTSTTVSLRDQRVGSSSTAAAGAEIGLARIYDFALESGSYNTTTPQVNIWDLSLFDVQTYTTLDVNVTTTLSSPVHLQGEQSGASAFLRYNVSAGTALTAYSQQGDFVFGERLSFNGVLDTSRFVTGVKKHSIADVKSVYSIVGTANTFNADTIQRNIISIGIGSISARDNAGISTISAPELAAGGFIGVVTTGNLIKYTIADNADPTILRVTGINGKTATVTGVTTVTGICEGSPPTSATNLTNISVVASRLQSSQGTGNLSSNDSIYSVLPKENIESVDLSGSNIVIRNNTSINIDANGLSQVFSVGDPAKEVFLAFDEERYSLLRSDGGTEILTADKFIFSQGNTQLQLQGLSSADPDATLITSTRKSNITSKTKLKNSTNNIIINKSKNSASGVGTATLQDGLTYGNYPFGTRVQDNIISLNVPDVIDVYGIFQSGTTEDPESPNLAVANMNGPSATTNDLILGETFSGGTSGAKARYIQRKNDTTISFVYLNDIVFEVGEPLSFSQSTVSGNASNIELGSQNVTRDYYLARGQRSSFYDFSRIIRKENVPEAASKLRVYFSNAYYASSDTGDVTTVDSYNSFDYSTEIPSVGNSRVTDIIDGRPRVTNYAVTPGSRSPLEFFGRNFNGGQHSSKNVIASDESITLGYNYYLARADRIYIDKNGSFSVKNGAPDDIPQLPLSVTDGMNVGNVFLPPYLYNTNDAKVTFIDHKRYQMVDISKIEQRVKNLEYYSSLNLLEQSTLNTFVPDINGLNRFKSGIFVDNFSSTLPQDLTIGIKNSIDTKRKILRPPHYSNAVNLQVGIGNTLLGAGVRRTGNIVTLDYANNVWLEQPFATRLENVTPFLINFYQGNIDLEPSVDVWIDTNTMQIRDVLMEGSFQGLADVIGAEVETAEDGSRIGVAPIVWDSWETVGAQLDLSATNRNESLAQSAQRNGTSAGAILAGQGIGAARIDTGRTTVQSTVINGSVSLEQTRTGSQQSIQEVINTESLGDRVVNREITHTMRSRNIKFTAKAMKPFTQVYSYFDGVAISRFTVPKLIEVTMTSGTFTVGETINGTMPGSVTTQQIGSSSLPEIVFRVAAANHKYGSITEPSDIYDSNPYTRATSLPTAYTGASTIINVDTDSLQSEEFSQFFGYIQSGMVLRGRTSGAEATITSVRLITDRVGTLIGSYRVPDPSSVSNPTFDTGRSEFRLTSSSINSRVKGSLSTSAQEIFYSQGDLDNTQEVTLSLRNARVSTNEDIEPESRQLVGESTEVNIIQDINVVRIPPPPPPPAPPAPPRPRGGDPLAQTFFVDDLTGIYLSKIDLFFQSKAANFPVTVQIRETRLGTPTNIVLPFSEVTLDPKFVEISEDGSVPTTFTFNSPVYLNGNTEYAVVVKADVTDYNVWISRFGEADITTAAQEAGQILVTQQPLLGSLFKSQNASVWTPSQYEDLKFVLYRCQFVSQGVVQFFNPELPQQLEKITRNGISITPRTISVGIGTTVNNTGVVAGRELSIGDIVTQTSSNFRGVLVGLAGSSTGNLGLSNPGIGYTPATSQFTHTGIALTAFTGQGVNATANITINNGVAIAATINAGGSGYNVGDVLAPLTTGSNAFLPGRDMKLSVNTLLGFNELEFSKVQGEVKFTANNYLQYTTSAGITSDVNVGVGGSLVPDAPVTVRNDGLHLKVFQRNHGMYSNTNRVLLKEVGSDITPTALSAQYTKADTGAISVGSTANLADFEGLPISVNNPGYVKIGSEIISYTGTAGNSLVGISSRSVDNTIAATHNINELVYRYEFGGVSLLRINKEHQFADVTVADAIGLDHYNIKVNMSTDGTDRSSTSPTLGSRYFVTSKTGGGTKVKGTYNLPYSIVIPKLRTVSPNGTSISSQMRTVTETSVSGSEISFLDKGYQEVSLNEKNYFDNQRMVVSSTNERSYLNGLPYNKSMTLNTNMLTVDNRLSPAIDLDHAAVVFVSNRANQPITNYATDSKAKGILGDPTSLMYVTRNIVLENPASSLRIFIDGYVSTFNDIRMFYALDQDLPATECVFTPFPGINNQSEFGTVLQPFNADGKPDVYVPPSDVYTQYPSLNYFKEYKFTIDNLTPFNMFRVKIIGTSTNQAIVPQFRNLRCVAVV